MMCLVQYLYWEAAVAANDKRRILKCRDCPFREKCRDEAKEETE